MDDTMEKATHMPATMGMPISLYLIQDRSDLEWKACLDEARNVFLEHHHSGWAYMVINAQHLFQLQHNT
jgi:hypothetical protein